MNISSLKGYFTKKIPATITDVETVGNNKLKVTLLFKKDFTAPKGKYLLVGFTGQEGQSYSVPVSLDNEQVNSTTVTELFDFNEDELESKSSFVKKGDIVLVSGPSDTPFTSGEINASKFLPVVIILAAFLLAFFGGVYYKSLERTNFSQAISSSIVGADPELLQNFLLENIRDGVNDDKTKAAIYFISHRFFDNGGDIHEIYNFINSHKEVAFLREAEKLNPAVFDLIKGNKVAKYDSNSVLALLCYYEIAQKHGYANLAMLGTAANKYAEFAYNNRRFSTTYGLATTTMDKRELSALDFVKKSIMFSDAANQLIAKDTDNTYDLKHIENKGYIDEDILVGLNQFASAQYFYMGMNEGLHSKILPRDIFTFNSDFAKRKVPQLYLFTNYLWATANIYNGTANMMVLATPLVHVIEYANSNKSSTQTGVLSRIINSKTNGEKSIFSHENATIMANGFKPFKDFLMQNGWIDKDFVIKNQ